jgi:hypothetical protein
MSALNGLSDSLRCKMNINFDGNVTPVFHAGVTMQKIYCRRILVPMPTLSVSFAEP